jgi:hypothetical protein
MTVAEFLEKFTLAPYDLSEIAKLVSQVTDNEDIVDEAKAFLDAKENLEMMLNDIGFEFG